MSEMDIDVLDSLLSSYIYLIVKELGNEGAACLHSILSTIRKVFDHIDPNQIQGSLVIFKTLNNDERPIDIHGLVSNQFIYGMHQTNINNITIQLLENSEILVWQEYPEDIVSLSESAIVYEYHNRTERFLANGQVKRVEKLFPNRSSYFAPFTFDDLGIALEEYKVKMVRYSSCEIFSTAWFDKNKIFFINRPEHIFRDSLTQFLKSRFRDRVEIRPEQNVDDSHPVDIKVTWMSTNRLGLIEIKWLGKSKDNDGNNATEYTEVRARSGAKQLSDYLDMNNVQAPESLTRGYLIVIDGRRRTPNDSIEDITLADGLYYQDKEVTYFPVYHEKRNDFETPKRMFVEPKCRIN